MRKTGITLIALIITVIVLLILAGITVSLVFGQNGIIERTVMAKENNKIAQVIEKVELAILDIDTQKVIQKEKLTVEEALNEIKNRNIFVEVKLEENIGICDGYEIVLGYNENEKVIIQGTQKHKQEQVKVILNPKSYTKDNVEVILQIAEGQGNVVSVEVPETMRKKADMVYEVGANGTYNVKIKLDTGVELEKEIVIDIIDRLAPKEVVVKAQNTGTGLNLIPIAEDADATNEYASSGIDRYEYYVKIPGNTEFTKYESAQIDGLDIGTYSVYIIAFDKAGNSLQSDTISAKVAVKFKNIYAGVASFGIDTDDNLWGWGYNETYGMVGDGTTTNRNSPVKIVIQAKLQKISIGRAHVMALDEEGRLWGWGRNEGRLGSHNSNASLKKPTKLDIETEFKDVSAGDAHTLALDKQGNIWAWGDNYWGALGDGTTTSRVVPVKLETEEKFVQISAGGSFSLAIDEKGNIWSWGFNGEGALGNGSVDRNRDVRKPTKLEIDANFITVAAQQGHVIAMDINNNIWSWGANNQGQLGNGSTTNNPSPSKVEIEGNIEKIASGRLHSLVLDIENCLWSWGDNEDGQLGDGTKINKTIPTKISTSEKFTQVFASRFGTDISFAFDEYGGLWAWGDNYKGYLGDGTNTTRLVPKKIY